MIKGLAHVCIAARDLADTERFYCQGLGFEKVFNFVKGGRAIGFYLRVADRAFVEVFQKDEVRTDGEAPIQHMCLEVSDVDEMRDRLIGRGYEVTEKRRGNDRSWQAWVTDPSGVRIEFHEYTPESSQVTGQDCVLG